MADDTSSQPIDSTSQSQSPPVPALPNNPASQNAQQIANETSQQRISDLEDRIRRGERWMIWLTGAIAFFALCQVAVAVVQYIYGGEQTNKIIAADERLATAMENSVNQAGNALKASIEASRTDQRAWVGMVGIDVNKAVEGSPFSYSVWIQNTGKTPALNVHIVTKSKSVPKKEIPQFTYELQPNTPIAATTIQPSMRVRMGGTPDSLGAPLTAGQIQSLKNGAAILYIYGKTDYEDIFKRLHHTRFCTFLEADLMSVHSCYQYNYAD